jgi:heme oxygenase (biliverdin-IX-beta and delta-forming)
LLSDVSRGAVDSSALPDRLIGAWDRGWRDPGSRLASRAAVSRTSPLAERLRAATHPLHEAAERALALGAGGLTLEAYRRVLAALLGYYAPLEASLIRIAQRFPQDIDLLGREKIPALRRDLRALGVSDAQASRIPLCPFVPDVSDVPRALGCLYVLEGATLGGRVIARQIREQLAIDARSGGAFFHAYGAETGSMWRSFQARLNREPPPHERTVSAAVETFERLERWLFDRGAPTWQTQTTGAQTGNPSGAALAPSRRST